MINSNRNDVTSYYYFNDEKKEICFKRYDMPTPWINYLSNGTFHTLISQAGGGVAFYRSPQIWRINRYRFFHLPTDRSGFYVYIKDCETGEYWCPTCEPAFIKPAEWESAHGLGYSRFNAERDKISSELVYFVGEKENLLIWNLKLKNDSVKTKNIEVYAYVEFGMMEFMRELQWQCYNKHQMSVAYLQKSGALIYKYGVEMQPKPEETPLVYFAADRMPDAYDGDRDEFIGSYRSESNPYAIESQGCTNSTLLGGDPCGALQFCLAIEPGKTETINIFLGTGMTERDIERSLERFREPGFVGRSFKSLKKGWDDYLNKFICDLPDEDAGRMVNIWNPYQVQRNFMFSRNISYYATGTFRGVGFRDTSQDILAQIPFDIEASREKVRQLLKEQYRDGHVNHYFFPTEGWDPVTSIHSDDHLWPVLSVWNIVMESGDLSFLNKVISFYDGGKATVYEHLCKSVDYSRNHLGENGFPLMLRSDWNDALFRVCREGRGESIWTAMQLGVVLPKLAELAILLNKPEDAETFHEFYGQQKKLVNEKAWDGKWYRRAIMDNGEFLGTEKSDEARIWLNAQSWSILSGMAEGDRGRVAMDTVYEMLNTDLGIKIIHPPIVNFPDPKAPLTNYNPGTGENGSVFCHANTWAIIAECMLGRGDTAYQYYRQLIPKAAMEKAGIWRYKAEPYAYASNIFGPESDKFGLANVSWLTGTAAWMYVAATQYILGVRPVWEGLVIDPCIPADWNHVGVEREFRGCKYKIDIYNEYHCSKGVKKAEVDGRVLHGNIIPHIEGRKTAKVKVVM